MAKSVPCDWHPRATSLLKYPLLRMASTALQSSLKRKTGARESDRGINTHHFSSALNAPLKAAHRPLTDLFTAQSRLCLAAKCSSKRSFDTHSLPAPVWPVCGCLSLTVGLQRGESQIMSGQRYTHPGSNTKIYQLSRLWLKVFSFTQKFENKKKVSIKLISRLFPGNWMQQGWKTNKGKTKETKMLLLHIFRPQTDTLWVL